MEEGERVPHSRNGDVPKTIEPHAIACYLWRGAEAYHNMYMWLFSAKLI